MTAWPIGKLNVEGNRIYSDEKILEAAGLKLGQLAGKAEFDAARDRLLATGAFESVGYKFEPIPGTGRTPAPSRSRRSPSYFLTSLMSFVWMKKPFVTI